MTDEERLKLCKAMAKAIKSKYKGCRRLELNELVNIGYLALIEHKDEKYIPYYYMLHFAHIEKNVDSKTDDARILFLSRHNCSLSDEDKLDLINALKTLDSYEFKVIKEFFVDGKDYKTIAEENNRYRTRCDRALFRCILDKLKKYLVH